MSLDPTTNAKTLVGFLIGRGIRKALGKKPRPCPRCGLPLRPTTRFCPRCGQKAEP